MRKTNVKCFSYCFQLFLFYHSSFFNVLNEYTHAHICMKNEDMRCEAQISNQGRVQDAFKVLNKLIY